MRTSILILAALLTACGDPAPDPMQDLSPTPDLAPPTPSPFPDEPVPPSSQGVGSNDVSILFPMPGTDQELDELLALDADGGLGPLLPRARFDELPSFTDNPMEKRAYAHWRVLGVRIDPCFPALSLIATDPASCHRQIRLVAQPIAPPTAEDQAIHLIYEMDAASFQAMATALVALGTTTTHDRATALGVHPTLLAEGLHGATAAKVRAIVLAHAGAQRLVRVTSMEGRGVAWEFRGFDPAAPLVERSIPGVEGPIQTMVSSDAGQVAAVPTEGPLLDKLLPLFALLSRPAGDAAPRFDAVIDAAIARSFDVDSPVKGLHPENLDCVSCHVAGRLRDRAFSIGHQSDADRYRDPRRNLRLSIPARLRTNPRELRAFGYNDLDAVFSQRTVDESAAVADAIEALLAK